MVLSSMPAESFMWGRRYTVEITGVDRIDRFVVTADAEPVLCAILSPYSVDTDDDALERLERMPRRRAQ